MCGFVSAQSPCWLRNRKRKLRSCRLRNYQRHCFPKRRLDSSAHTVPLDSKIISKTESLPLRKHQRDCLHSWSLDSFAHTVLVDSEIINESLVAVDSETINDIASTIVAWIHQRTKFLFTQKSQAKTELLSTQKPSTRLPPQLSPGFVSAHSPCWLGNRHRKPSRCQLENCHRNYFPSWRFVSSTQTVPIDSVSSLKTK